MSAAPAALRVAELLAGKWISRALCVAAELGVADALAGGPRTLDALAQQLQCDATSLARLLRALVSIEILRLDDAGHYANTELGDCLRSGQMRDACRMLGADWHDAAWQQLAYSVRTGNSGFGKAHGQPLFDWLGQHPAAADVFNGAMTAGRAYRDRGIAEGYPFGDGALVIDVGGGQGGLLSSILDADAERRGILFDLPEVIAGNGSALSPTARERCALVAGSFFEAVPGAGDVYLLGHVLHDWSDADAIRILSRCREAMSTQARLLLLESILPSATTRDRAHFLDLEMLVLTEGGRERDLEAFTRLLRQAGFELLRCINTGATRAILEAQPQ